jgi:hypothetical protein
MEFLLLILAWALAIASVFMIADTIAVDLANRRADRVAARQIDRARATRHLGRHRR